MSSMVISPLHSGVYVTRAHRCVGCRYIDCDPTLLVAGGGRARDGAAPRFKAVAFDYFVLFDPDSVVPRAEELFPGKGRQLTTLWRTRQFEYTWLRSVADRYVDFSAVTRDALAYSAQCDEPRADAGQSTASARAYLHLTPWPDTVGTLQTLSDRAFA